MAVNKQRSAIAIAIATDVGVSVAAVLVGLAFGTTLYGAVSGGLGVIPIARGMVAMGGVLVDSVYGVLVVATGAMLSYWLIAAFRRARCLVASVLTGLWTVFWFLSWVSFEG